MGLGPADTAYLIRASLVISGVATFVQINRVGLQGDGLPRLLLAGLVFLVIVKVASVKHVWLRLSSITLGCAAAYSLPPSE